MLKIIFLSFIFVLDLLGATPSEYLLPAKHPLKKTLEKIFASPHVIDNQATIDEAGFTTLYHQASGMRVLKHERLPGYLVKTYLNDERERPGDDIQWMVDRCLGAANIRHLIREEKIGCFTVPDKWIYLLPGQPFASSRQQIAILLVTDMELVSRERSVKAWQTKITRKHLQELHCILSHGFGSLYLPYNIPYTKNGTFAFVDTAYPQRVFDLTRINRYLSHPMRRYWNVLINQ